ncbi:sugar ABC transporter ATP-binding protein [Portibacter lacus]|uniref:Ribose import ATP-binding protein RbsA 2 n=1 Tax=Portibacter lacus TaxID=1099794 RepID=A0AA37WHT5_9BACT|nr:sugar ABC transporter ATP-binding protein [Portibacter lacus]GLR19934.1 ribose import ATP-binding protein RbsA 2 [Portibacter lacus]
MKEQRETILQAKSITKKFGKVTVLDDVNIDVHQGKVNVIIGENGAGKSTLMKILSGVYSDYDGEILLNNKVVNFSNPKEAMENGIAIMHQELNLIPYLSITANIFLGREITNQFGILSTNQMHDKVDELLKRLDCNLSPRTLVSELRVGEQQLVEIAKALLEDAKVIIMDEPTSAISDSEVEVLFKIIKNLKTQDVGILYISHKLDELFTIADRFIGLRDGKMVGIIEDVRNTGKEDLIKLMVGRNIENRFQKEILPIGDDLLGVENLNLIQADNKARYLLKDINFSLKKGEVLGIFGLMGAGRTELLETLFGLYPKLSTCKLTIEKKEVNISSVQDAILNGLALVPENRKEDGLVLQMDVSKNISMVSTDRVIRNGFLNKHLETNLARKYIDSLHIKLSSEKQLARNLSGGNQQKVVLAKWLANQPKVLFLDEPTRGIDVNAKNEIYHLISQLASKGLGLIVVSSELPEIMAISDRILILSQGKITGEFNRTSANEEAIMQAATST